MLMSEAASSASFLDEPKCVVLPGLAPARITCAFRRTMTSRHAASRTASTVTVWRRNWSLRQAAGTCG